MGREGLGGSVYVVGRVVFRGRGRYVMGRCLLIYFLGKSITGLHQIIYSNISIQMSLLRYTCMLINVTFESHIYSYKCCLFPVGMVGFRGVEMGEGSAILGIG